MSNCGCGSSSYPSYQSKSISICDPCNTNTGCAIQLDFDCIIYHKDNNEVTNLTCLGLTNGATLNQFAEAIDPYICQIKAQNYALPCLRDIYTINTLQQFAEAVDTELCLIKDNITEIEALVNLPISTIDTNSVDLTATGVNNHTLSANVKISSTPVNLVNIFADGLHVAPQTLSVNYTTKELSISNGNTVDLSGLVCGASGFLGNLAADPSSPSDGQYWYNTTSNELKIRVNGATRIITIT